MAFYTVWPFFPKSLYFVARERHTNMTIFNISWSIQIAHVELHAKWHCHSWPWFRRPHDLRAMNGSHVFLPLEADILFLLVHWKWTPDYEFQTVKFYETFSAACSLMVLEVLHSCGFWLCFINKCLFKRYIKTKLCQQIGKMMMIYSFSSLYVFRASL